MERTTRQYHSRRDQRREKERYRRQQQRMKRVRKIRQGILCAAGFAVVLTVIWVFRGMVLPGKAENSRKAVKMERVSLSEESEEMVEQTEASYYGIPYEKELKELEKEDSRVGQVLEHAENYPERVLKMLSKNIETLDFVLDYQEKKNLPCADTIGEAPEEGEIPLLIQWDERWGYGAYGESFVAVSGCGPTCIAMVASGLTGRNDITPYTVASYSEENGFLTSEMDTSWDLMTYGCEEFGVTGTMLGLDENLMANTLANGYPVICSMGAGDFTDNGHFIVLTSYENGRFHVNDPNSKIRSGQTWSYDDLKDQIVNMWWYERIW